MITIARIIEKFKPEIIGKGLRKQGWLISEMQGNGKDIYINVWGDNIEKYKEINDGIFYFSLSVKSSLYNGKYYTNVSLLELFELVDDEKNENNKSYYNNEDPEEALARLEDALEKGEAAIISEKEVYTSPSMKFNNEIKAGPEYSEMPDFNESYEESIVRLEEALEKGEAAILSPTGEWLYTPPSMRNNNEEKIKPNKVNFKNKSGYEDYFKGMSEEEADAFRVTPERSASLSKFLKQSQEEEQSNVEGFGISDAIAALNEAFDNETKINENTDLDALRTDFKNQLIANVPNITERDMALEYLDKKIAEAKAKKKPKADPPVTPTISTSLTTAEKARLDEITDRKKEIKLNRVIGDDPTYALEEYKRLKSEENSILSKYFPTTITTAEKARIDEISDRLEEIVIVRAISKDPRYALEEYQKLLNENQSILSKYIPKDELPPF